MQINVDNNNQNIVSLKKKKKKKKLEVGILPNSFYSQYYPDPGN